MTQPLALVVDEVPPRRDQVGRALTGIGWSPYFSGVHEAFAHVDHKRPDVVIVAGGENDPEPGVECLQRLRAAFSRPRYLFLASNSSEDLAIAALNAGAHRYLRTPWTPPMLQSAVTSLVPHGAPHACHEETVPLVGEDRLIGQSRVMRELRVQIARAANVNSNVLVLGETGTGKELIAELIHLNGGRATKPLVCLNTAAIPEQLLENELFGHERGAFTGATSSEIGKLTAANGGTVFFDEIGDMSLAMQAKLLRVLENKSVYRLGGTRSICLDVRTIAATNVDLRRAAAEGRFRQDLYYRLNVVRIELPPLRERPEDIPLLIGHYLLHFNRELGRSVQALSPRAMDTLCSYYWPGNVRELRNVVESLLVNVAPDTTGAVDLPPPVLRQLALAVDEPISERDRLLNVLTSTQWNKTKAADELGISRMTLYRKMHQHRVASRR